MAQFNLRVLGFIWTTLILSSIFVQFSVTQEERKKQTNPCNHKTTCSECITGGRDCVWCKLQNITLSGRERCDSMINMQMRCPEKDIVNPKGETILKKDVKLSSPGEVVDNIVQLMPQEILLKMKPNSPERFNLKFRQAEDYPVDLYFLMDLSNSMADDKEKVASFGNLLNTEMTKITRNFRLGFGSFVDKVTMPYVSTVPRKLLSPCDGCDPPYGFQHHMSLSSDADAFVRLVTDTNISGNLDNNEGTFDAMMQAIVCTKQIGWREHARKILLVATDAGFHMAGDGKLAGIVLPNDGKCHLNENGMYTESLNQDYPSISQMSSKAQEHKIHILFAATTSEFNVYEELSSKIEGSHVGELTSNSDNIVELIKEQYQKISSEVELKHSASHDIKVTFYSNCLKGKFAVLEKTNVCSGLKVGSTIDFTVEVEVLSCPKDRRNWEQSFQIFPIGINEALSIKLNMFCECDCEKPENEVRKSSHCHNIGTYKCGVCDCPKERIGQFCQCDSSKAESDSDETKCRKDNSSALCSGRGFCTCGECACYPEKSELMRVYGDFCECDNFNCRIALNDVMCAGHGKCDCRKCICDPGWIGDDCYCPSVETSCKASNGEICSGHGECNCGVCQCEPHFGGIFCEQNNSPGAQCKDLSTCVDCAVFAKENFTVECLSCNYTITLVDEAKVEREDEHRCAIKDENGCQFFFVYTQMKDKSDPRIRAQKTKECPPPVNVALVSMSVIGSVVAIGVCTLLVWKVITEVHDRREFARFERDRQLAKWQQGQNPIYVQAVSTFSNPTYGENDEDY